MENGKRYWHSCCQRSTCLIWLRRSHSWQGKGDHCHSNHMSPTITHQSMVVMCELRWHILHYGLSPLELLAVTSFTGCWSLSSQRYSLFTGTLSLTGAVVHCPVYDGKQNIPIALETMPLKSLNISLNVYCSSAKKTKNKNANAICKQHVQKISLQYTAISAKILRHKFNTKLCNEKHEAYNKWWCTAVITLMQ